MKTLFYIILIIAICQSCKDNSDKFDFSQPQGTAKIIETRYYNPMKYNDEWICGTELSPLDEFFVDSHIRYLDSKGRVLGIDMFDGAFEINRWIRIKYRGESDDFEQIIFKLWDDVEVANYERDGDGKLIAIKTTDDREVNLYPFFESAVPTQFIYDDDGNLVTKKEKNAITSYKQIPSPDDLLITQIESWHDDDNQEYDCTIEIKDKETGKILKKTEECYFREYNILHSQSETTYFYDDEGNLKRRISNEKHVPLWMPIPTDIVTDREKSMDYKREQYNKMSEMDYKKWERREEYTNIEYREVYTRYEAMKVYVQTKDYVYNEKGDWIQCLVSSSNSDAIKPELPIFNPNKKKTIEIGPEYFITRKITYLE